MIQTEQVGERIRTYSDEGMQIKQDQTGILYYDAVDIPGKYTYTETDIPIEDMDITAEQALDILMGGDGHADDAGDGDEVP